VALQFSKNNVVASNIKDGVIGFLALQLFTMIIKNKPAETSTKF
jgi:hypothetical protein